MPKISVVMSVFNGEKYLHPAMDSILNQSFDDFEFIIIEDCSTDGTLDILLDYQKKDDRIKIIRKEKNNGHQGFIENLNLGIKHATGEYIARMDADDISRSHRFQLQYEFLTQHPAVFIVGSSLQLIDENGHATGTMDTLEDDAAIQASMYQHIRLYHPSIMFRNDGTVHYREKMFYCEDYDLYFRLMHSGKQFANIKEPLVEYRILPSSISRNDPTFTRRLFVEKARSFYKEREAHQHDSYENFSPDTWIHILKDEIVPSEVDLTFALKVAIKYQYQPLVDQLYQKAKVAYPKNSHFKWLNLLAKLPAPFNKIAYKLWIAL